MTRLRRKKGEPIDWAEVRQRLARAEAATREALAPSADRAKALLDGRARALARPLSDARDAGPKLELLAFALGRERYAIETKFVREVLRSSELTPVPGAPSFIAGIANLRGEMLAVIDLRRFLGIEAGGLPDLARVVVLGTDAVELGVLADSVDDLEQLPAAEVLPAAEPLAGVGREYLKGFTRSALVVLDGAALLDDPRLVVDQTQAAPTPHAGE